MKDKRIAVYCPRCRKVKVTRYKKFRCCGREWDTARYTITEYHKAQTRYRYQARRAKEIDEEKQESGPPTLQVGR